MSKTITTKKRSVRAGERVSSTRPSTGSTAAPRRVSRSTKSERPPRTAYDLCERVAQHIEEEPRRYNQGTWALLSKARIKKYYGYPAPTCGTVCCRAGWVVALHDGLRAKPLVEASTVGWDIDDAVAKRANRILGVTDTITYALFDGDALAQETDTWSGALPTKGTAEYAALGAKGLRAWMQRHARHLKARLLSDVPKLEGQS